jgi:hypothetical protein
LINRQPRHPSSLARPSVAISAGMSAQKHDTDPSYFAESRISGRWPCSPPSPENGRNPGSIAYIFLSEAAFCPIGCHSAGWRMSVSLFTSYALLTITVRSVTLYQ